MDEHTFSLAVSAPSSYIHHPIYHQRWCLANRLQYRRHLPHALSFKYLSALLNWNCCILWHDICRKPSLHLSSDHRTSASLGFQMAYISSTTVSACSSLARSSSLLWLSIDEITVCFLLEWTVLQPFIKALSDSSSRLLSLPFGILQ